MNELLNTVPDMLSEDWRKRCRGEYLQLKIRTQRLQAMLDKRNRNELDFKPLCPKNILERQLIYMKGYLDAMEQRAYIEGFPLEEDKT